MAWKELQAENPSWEPGEDEKNQREELKRKIHWAKQRIKKMESSLKLNRKCAAHLEKIDARYQIVKQGKKRAQHKSYRPLVTPSLGK